MLKHIIATSVGVLFALGASAQSASAQEVLQWETIKPSTTGIPGELMQLMKFDPQGNLWVAARWPFWRETGIAMLPADDVPLEEWPFGGFDTGRWTTWTNVHYPLPSEYINDMEFSVLNDGIIWLATGTVTGPPDEGGLVRFDPAAPDGSPQQWFTYNAANSPLNVDGVLSIDQDSEGNLWLTNVANAAGSGKDALFRFNPQTNEWTEFNVAEELPWELPWTDLGDVLVSSNGHVWLTHPVLGGLAEYDGQTWQFHDNGAYGFGSMMEDNDGNIWLIGNVGSHGLWKWDGESFTHWPTIGGEQDMLSMAVDDAGTVYIGTWNGNIFRMQNGVTPVLWTTGAYIPLAIEPHASGDVFIATRGAVRHYDAGGMWLEGLNTYNTGLPWYFISQIYCDPDGQMWFSSGEAGASRHDDGRWRNFGLHNAGSEPWPFVDDEPIDGVFQDSQGDVWLGGNGIMRWHEATGEVRDFWDYQEVSSSGGDFAETPDGRVWAGRANGIYWYNEQTQSWEHLIFGDDNTVKGMCIDAAGQLCVVTASHLRIFDGQNWTHWNLQNAPIPLGEFSSIAAHPDGSIWMGHEKGLFRFDGVNWTHHTKSNSGLYQDSVTDVKIRPDGLIAASCWDFDKSLGGVSLFDGAQWTSYTPQNAPLNHWQIEAVEFDQNGDLWLSTMSEGVMIAHLEPTVDTAQLTSIDVTTGALLDGTLADLLESDDSYLHLASEGGVFGFVRKIELVVSARTEQLQAGSMDVAVEARQESLSWLAAGQVFVRNWETGKFDRVAMSRLNTTDRYLKATGIDPANYVDAHGNIELKWSATLFQRTPVDFEAFVDHVEIILK
jgi:ligand-binding sensor domain-containing protein